MRRLAASFTPIPENDGFSMANDYPKGAGARESVQRGSVMDTDYPGDPLTPGVGATADAKRIEIKDAKTITKIPVLPISWAMRCRCFRRCRGR